MTYKEENELSKSNDWTRSNLFWFSILTFQVIKKSRGYPVKSSVCLLHEQFDEFSPSTDLQRMGTLNTGYQKWPLIQPPHRRKLPDHAMVSNHLLHISTETLSQHLSDDLYVQLK